MTLSIGKPLRYTCRVIVVAVLFARPVEAVAPFTINLSSFTETLETHIHPNPRVQEPTSTLGPVKPLQKPTAPPATGGERFARLLADVLTREWHHNMLILLPATTTDPNSGPTLGVMPVLMVIEPVTHR